MIRVHQMIGLCLCCGRNPNMPLQCVLGNRVRVLILKAWFFCNNNNKQKTKQNTSLVFLGSMKGLVGKGCHCNFIYFLLLLGQIPRK